jgi:hypothetical protein
MNYPEATALKIVVAEVLLAFLADAVGLALVPL